MSTYLILLNVYLLHQSLFCSPTEWAGHVSKNVPTLQICSGRFLRIAVGRNRRDESLFPLTLPYFLALFVDHSTGSINSGPWLRTAPTARGTACHVRPLTGRRGTAPISQPSS